MFGPFDRIHQMKTLNMITVLQWAPLNGITLGPRQTDPINPTIPLTDTHVTINSKKAIEILKK
jgi:hypothetical protein